MNAIPVERGSLSYGSALVEMATVDPWEDDFFLTLTQEKGPQEAGLSVDLGNPTETFLR